MSKSFPSLSLAFLILHFKSQYPAILARAYTHKYISLTHIVTMLEHHTDRRLEI